MKTKTRVLLADDHKIMREGLRALIANQEDMEVVAEAENGRQTVQLALELMPDVIIMDISMPGLNGIEAIREISSRAPGIRSLALSMYSDKRYVSRALKEGAAGYLLKDCAFEELIQAIGEVASGRTYLSPPLVNVVVEDYVQRISSDEPSDISSLTARERQVLRLYAEGVSTKKIAHELAISVKTVETYRSQLMAKLGVQSVAELTKVAIRAGLTSL